MAKKGWHVLWSLLDIVVVANKIIELYHICEGFYKLCGSTDETAAPAWRGVNVGHESWGSYLYVQSIKTWDVMVWHKLLCCCTDIHVQSVTPSIHWCCTQIFEVRMGLSQLCCSISVCLLYIFVTEPELLLRGSIWAFWTEQLCQG